MTSVRALIRGEGQFPPFRMLLPPSWEEHVVSDRTAEQLSRRASDVMRQSSRPDLDAQLANSIRRAFSAMQKVGSKIVYLPIAKAGESVLPMSTVASVVRGENGGSLDPYVTVLFRDKGAGFFDTLKSTVRWEQIARGTGELAGATSHMVNYVIAVPDSGRRLAVLFTTTVMSGDQEPIDDQFLDECIALSDAMISTFAWVNPDAAGVSSP